MPAKQEIEPVKHNLDLNERLSQHKKGWKIQRAGWFIMLLIILAAALGVFGEGIISRRRPVKDDFAVHFDAYYRYESMMRVRVESGQSHISSVGISQDYLKDFKIESINPEPKQTVISNGLVEYVFEGNQNRVVSFYLTPQEFGNINGTLRVNNQSFPIHHFIYP